MLLTVGVATIARFGLPAAIDELAHLSNVKTLTEERRLPVLTDRMQPELVAFRQRVYPAPPRFEPEGIGTFRYEAFQPPLYYALAAPVLAATPGGLRTEFRVLRTLNLAILLLAVWVLFLFTRRVFGDDHLLPFAFGLFPFLWPGVVVRSVCVSNAALEILVTLLFLHVLWRADADRDRRALVVAATLFGVAVLTKLTLVFLGVLLAGVTLRLLWRLRDARTVGSLAVAALIPALMLAPWVLFNEDRYGAPTANAAAREQQAPYILPGNRDFGFDQAADRLPKLLEGFLPQEWDASSYLPDLDSAADYVPLLLLAPVCLLFLTAPGRILSREAFLLGLPLVLGVGQIFVTLWFEEWDIFFPRYLYPVLPGLALLGAMGLRQAVPRRAAFAYTTVAAGICAAAWINLAGTHYFSDVGNKLGIG